MDVHGGSGWTLYVMSLTHRTLWSAAAANRPSVVCTGCTSKEHTGELGNFFLLLHIFVHHLTNITEAVPSVPCVFIACVTPVCTQVSGCAQVCSSREDFFN
jgi:hypothetical protein